MITYTKFEYFDIPITFQCQLTQILISLSISTGLNKVLLVSAMCILLCLISNTPHQHVCICQCIDSARAAAVIAVPTVIDTSEPHFQIPNMKKHAATHRMWKLGFLSPRKIQHVEIGILLGHDVHWRRAPIAMFYMTQTTSLGMESLLYTTCMYACFI